MTVDKAKFEMFVFFAESVWGDWTPGESQVYNLYNEQNELVDTLSWLDIKNGFLNCNTKEELDNLINVKWTFIDDDEWVRLNELLEDIDTE